MQGMSRAPSEPTQRSSVACHRDRTSVRFLFHSVKRQSTCSTQFAAFVIHEDSGEISCRVLKLGSSFRAEVRFPFWFNIFCRFCVPFFGCRTF